MQFQYDFSDYKAHDFDPKQQARRLLASVHAASDATEDKAVAKKRLGYAIKEIENQRKAFISSNEQNLAGNVESIFQNQSKLTEVREKMKQLTDVYERMRSLVTVPYNSASRLHDSTVNLHSTYTSLYWIHHYFDLQKLLVAFADSVSNEHERFENYFRAATLLQEMDQLVSRYPLIKRQSSVQSLHKSNIGIHSRMLKETSSFLLAQEDSNVLTANSSTFSNACATLFLLDKYLLERNLSQMLSSRSQKANACFESIFQLSPTTRRLLHSSADSTAANSTIWSKFEDGWYQISKIGSQCVFWEKTLKQTTVCQPYYTNLLEYFQAQPNFILDGATISMFYFKELAISISTKMQNLDRRDPTLLQVFRNDYQRVTHIVEQAIAKSSSEIVTKDTRECSIVINSLKVLFPKIP
ncbi:transport complex subunit Cog5 [Schizosaccharomyces cryophilus OY26]|uniref:Conserved oligomeric Golgi complex subunit 5 n=1 Tax=Schizosaccharomyces cryophilus (strain OY26 / ATCC MYA-4695 / CBS 11777 / NBRC 106824 / NRRL Y48691) TaxID=653667 RepID=S9VZ34_SCHCR|nr:transport complex subunit Cog5 [Schizosaccharomyces cryophilus OY26]EPY52868.1 transport complex subunit Cog5 [Schizosaccharomyces cryophilus OY26]